MPLIEKCVCFKTGEVNVQKPSLWLLLVDATSHFHLPFFFKLLCFCFLAVSWSLQGQHKLL